MFTGPLAAVSNRATWSEVFEIADAETGELLVFDADDEIDVEVRDANDCVVFSGSLLDGTVGIVSDGVFQVTFTDTQMRTLCGKTYRMDITLTRDEEVTHLFALALPVIDRI